jgi:glycine/D-amino acid oxidase-like deaminating enzyme
MLDINTTEQSDLRSDQSPWSRLASDLRDGLVTGDVRCDVLIVGGGITGALMAQHLAGRGRNIVLIDRERPGLGSTAASTAMLQWEIDAPLAELTDLYGFETAADIYRRSFRAVAGLQSLVTTLGVPCSFRERTTLYLAAGDAGRAELSNEHTLRQRAGLPGHLLNHVDLLAEAGFDREAAILSPGSADADPLCLAQGLLSAAKQAGVKVLSGEAIQFDHGPRTVMVGLDGGRVIEAGHVVLATGYVMPDFVPAESHAVVSSWALSTMPQPAGSLWQGESLVWEASESYHYMRSTADGRIIIGGEDAEITDADARDKLISQKTATLQNKLADLWPRASTEVSSRWAGFFGETDDGLPLIGRVPGHPRILAAYGYGGNGITFSFMASRILSRLIDGHDQSWFQNFALDRPKS